MKIKQVKTAELSFVGQEGCIPVEELKQYDSISFVDLPAYILKYFDMQETMKLSQVSKEFLANIQYVQKFVNFTEAEIIQWHNQKWDSLPVKFKQKVYKLNDAFIQREFFNEPVKAAKAVANGDVDWSHKYVTICEKGNLFTFNEIEEENSPICEGNIFPYYMHKMTKKQ